MKATQWIGIAAGVLFAFVTVWYAHELTYPVFEFDSPVALIPFVALTALGAAPVILVLEYRLVTPLVILPLPIVLWLQGEADPGPGDPFVGLVVLTPFWVAVIAAVGGVEYWIRKNVNV